MTEPHAQCSAESADHDFQESGFDTCRLCGERKAHPSHWITTDVAQSVGMREALEPFAKLAALAHKNHRDSRPIMYGFDPAIAERLTIGDLRRAAAALAAEPPAAPVSNSAELACGNSSQASQHHNGDLQPSSAEASHNGCSAGNVDELREEIEHAIRSMVTVTESTDAIMKILAAQPQPAGCGTPGCTDPNCEYGKEPPARDDIAEAIFKTLRPDNPNHVNELFPSAADIYFAAADAVLALSRPQHSGETK